MAKSKTRKSNAKANRSKAIELNGKRKKEFFDRLKALLTQVELQDCLTLFSKKDLDNMYQCRVPCLRLAAENDDKLPSDFLNYLHESIVAISKNLREFQYKSYPKFSAFDLITVLLTFFLHANHNSYNEKWEGLSPFLDFIWKEVLGAVRITIEFTQILCNAYVLPSHGFLKFSLSFPKREGPSGIKLKITYIFLNPEKKHVAFNGFSRPVYRIGFVRSNEFKWAGIKSSLVGGSGIEEYPVYIQQHALDRMQERLDVVALGNSVKEVGPSVEGATEAIPMADQKYMVPYYFADHKLGYLVGSVCDGMFIIRTFLFITHTGTPEGILLDKLTGLSKLDKKYLLLDKLSAFIKSDLSESAHVSAILNDAQIGYLLNITSLVESYTFERGRYKQIGAKVEQYLSEHCLLGVDENEMEEEEPVC